eukprot:CAMPEP_0176044150 /NCGR_PEP_ID=MMETSP0120_2-20121206/21912_1 /TAXON_ID=160619 /ORGANISM="Kryptoperidinium foliaceum, Strain CCMP 1326" /LENGTH=424 /DNA_ID=CAMNT_0017377557 /DNA_START=166 /DNA_END=1436 /DNA_ORIENTATION=+
MAAAHATMHQICILFLLVCAISSQDSAARSPQSGDAPATQFSIPLQKQYVPVQKGGKVVAYKTAYFGSLQVGGEEPRQTFTVVFDTGSGHLILPSTSCRSETCGRHRRYSRAASPSAVDIEYDGTLISPDAAERDQVSIAFGTGQVLGEFVREVVCLGDGEGAEAKSGERGCVNLRVVLATEMTEDPFGLFAFDGVLGLGLDALTLAPQFSFFAQMAEQHPAVQPRFAVYLARNDGGESRITFGGHEELLASSELEWAPVAMKELGYWQVKIKSVRVGSTVVEDCADGSCRAILDTGTSLLGVPRQSARSLHKMLARQVAPERYDDAASIDCRTVAGQSLEFELESGAIVSLGAEDYSRPTPFNITISNSSAWRLFCRSLLLPVDMPAPLGPKVFIWGEPMLRRYYTVYDLANKRVGFTLAQAR